MKKLQSAKQISAERRIREWPHEDAILRHEALLNAFPDYKRLFDAMDISRVCLLSDVESVKQSIGQVFDARLSFHVPGRLARDIALVAPEVKPSSPSLAGYMSRYGDNFTSYLVAVTAADETCRSVDTGSVLHEYGHYVEQRQLKYDRMIPAYAPRETSFSSACLLVLSRFPDLTGEAILVAADELVAWTNALWLAWIFQVDPRVVFCGMVLDEISNPAKARLTRRVLPDYLDLFRDRELAERQFEFYSGIQFTRFSRISDVHDKSRLVDGATRALFDYLLRTQP